MMHFTILNHPDMMARIIIHANLGRYCWWASEKGSKLCVVKEVSDFFDLANARMHQSQSGRHRLFSLFLSTPFDVFDVTATTTLWTRLSSTTSQSRPKWDQRDKLIYCRK